MAFNSQDYAQGQGVSKILEPGTHMVKIIDMNLNEPPFKLGSYYVNFMFESEEIGGDFIGIAKDKTNPSLGNYNGQVGFVKNGQFPYSDFVYNGRESSRDDQIFKFLNSIASKLGVLEKIQAEGVNGETIEEYFDNIKPYLLNIYATWIFAGDEYFTEGYDKPNYRLYLPKYDAKNDAKGSSYVTINYNEDGDPIGLIKFDVNRHITRKKDTNTEEVKSFGSDTQIDIPKNPFENLPVAETPMQLNLELPVNQEIQPNTNFDLPKTGDLPF